MQNVSQLYGPQTSSFAKQQGINNLLTNLFDPTNLIPLDNG